MARTIDCLISGASSPTCTCSPWGCNRPSAAADSYHVDPIEVVTGGIVCNTGVGLARLGGSVAAASLDWNGISWADVIRSRLTAEGIDTQPLIAHDTLGTSTTAVLIGSRR